MLLNIAYIVLFFFALAVMLSQLLIKPVKVENILIAILSGSLSMVALQVLTSEPGNPYQYVFALGTCATCNIIWLISRAFFRGSDSLAIKHYLFAAVIAILVFANRTVDLLVSIEWINSYSIDWLKRSISELIQLLSSTTLALAFWESIRGFNRANNLSKWQRSLFAVTFFTGVFSCTVISDGVLSEDARLTVKPWLVVMSAMSILLTTFIIAFWQYRERLSKSSNELLTVCDNPLSEDIALFSKIKTLMTHNKLFLQHDLKMIDIANKLNVSEYKISQAVRHCSNAANLNQFINTYRLAHAKQLLTDENKQHWTILVISLESGFASLAPFNRAFKASENCTPSQYRLASRREAVSSDSIETAISGVQ